MINIGITGIDGLIGWHLRSFLHGQEGVALHGADKAEFASEETLNKFAGSCDVIVHLAGMNRGDESEIARTNVGLTKALIKACKTAGSKPHIIFSSSTQIYSGTAYGKSKIACAELLKAWAAVSGAKFTNFVLPNVFGEGGKPFYNSAVSTFCFQLANSQEPKILVDKEMDILHAQRVAGEIFAVIKEAREGEIVLPGARVTVSGLLSKLRGMADLYGRHIVPDLRAPEDLDLFNTYRSYLFPKNYPGAITLKKDARGSLFEAEKSLTGGQVFISTTEPGVTRGNHYHTRKFERFLVIRGKGLIKVRKLFSNEVSEFAVDGASPGYIDMPALHTHNITNVGGGELTALFYAHEILDPAAPDTYLETV